MKKRVNKFVYWIPRVLSIIFVIFLALMSLDVFDICSGFLNCALGLFMHNIPALILLVIVIVSWKYEIVGGVGFILGGLVYIALILFGALRNSFEWYMLVWILQISGVAFLIGILYLINWRKK